MKGSNQAQGRRPAAPADRPDGARCRSLPASHFQKAAHAREVEPGDHAVVGLLDEEAARGVRQGAHQVELVLGQAEAFDIVGGPGAGIGKKIWVAACSTMAEAMWLCRASPALCVQKPTTPLRLRMGLLPSRESVRRTGVVQRLPALVDHDE